MGNEKKKNEKHGILTEDTTVYDAVKNHPVLKNVLRSVSKNYEKLENPVVFNTAARITTFKSAAKIGRVYVYDLLMKLNEAIGKKNEFEEYMKNRLPSMQKEFMDKMSGSAETAKRPQWLDKKEEFEAMDVREAKEPFSAIMKKASETGKGRGFVLVQKFEPAPVIDNLAKKGFEVFVERASEEEYRVYFYRKEGKSND